MRTAIVIAASLSARYMDTKQMLPDELAHAAAAMLRQQAEQIEQLEVERLRLAGEVLSCGDCPTRDYKQPALSDLIELAKVYSQQYASPHHIVFSVDGLRHLIEAHLKGQK